MSEQTGIFFNEALEYSSRIDKLLASIVAAANSDGGTVCIGACDFEPKLNIQDYGEIKRHVAILFERVMPRFSPSMITFVETVKRNRPAIAVEITRGPKRPYWLVERGLSPNGVRTGKHGLNVPATPDEFAALMRETGDRFETRRSPVQALTFERAVEVFDRAKAPFGAEERRAFGCYDASGSFSNLGLLLSDQAPSTIRVAIMEDGDQTVRSANLSGSIFSQLESALTSIDKRNKRFTKARYGIADAKEYRSIPVDAVQETLVNAVLHRDYDSPVPTLVRIYDDRVEVLSRGGLPDGIAPNELEIGASVPRNPNLVRVFEALHSVSASGLGMARIRRAYDSTSLTPKIETTRHFFKTTLYCLFEPQIDGELRVAKFSPARFSVNNRPIR